MTKPGEQSGDVGLPRNRRHGKRDDEVDDEDADVGAHSSMPGFPSLSPIAKSAPKSPKIAPLAPTVGTIGRAEINDASPDATSDTM